LIYNSRHGRIQVQRRTCFVFEGKKAVFLSVTSHFKYCYRSRCRLWGGWCVWVSLLQLPVLIANIRASKVFIAGALIIPVPSAAMITVFLLLYLPWTWELFSRKMLCLNTDVRFFLPSFLLHERVEKLFDMLYNPIKFWWRKKIKSHSFQLASGFAWEEKHTPKFSRQTNLCYLLYERLISFLG